MVRGELHAGHLLVDTLLVLLQQPVLAGPLDLLNPPARQQCKDQKIWREHLGNVIRNGAEALQSVVEEEPARHPLRWRRDRLVISRQDTPKPVALSIPQFPDLLFDTKAKTPRP